MLMVPNLRLIEPNNIYRKVPTRKPNAEMRTREYLTPTEVEKLIAAAKLGRHGQRDATLILVAFRHGLRAVEIACPPFVVPMSVIGFQELVSQQINSRKSLRMVLTANYRTLMLRPLRSNAVASI